jgi:hypothetical protein
LGIFRKRKPATPLNPRKHKAKKRDKPSYGRTFCPDCGPGDRVGSGEIDGEECQTCSGQGWM